MCVTRSKFADEAGVPESTEWSREIGWGHAWSADGVRWMMGQEPVLMPGVLGSFDHMGVFTVRARSQASS